MSGRRLTREDIAETTGVSGAHLGALLDLEILFLTCEEIDKLDSLKQLRSLTMLDNGLKRISNLHPVANTLMTLCLCDQNIVKMENLNLPNLRDLFLHRNMITSIGGLNGCPKLKKLWLFQNQISVIEDLYSVPELQECWLQSNKITTIDGLEHSNQIVSLGLAGNPINDFAELKKLSVLEKLKALSLSDIHFGRCPVVDDKGYREFVICFLRQVKFLDGVEITADRMSAAEAAYAMQYKQYQDDLLELEDEYRRDLNHVESQQKVRENHALVLEKEMSNALVELQKLVNEGRIIISNDVDRQMKLLDSNMRSLEQSLTESYEKAINKLNENSIQTQDDYDITASLFCILERVSSAEAQLVEILCEVSSSDKAKKSMKQTSQSEKNSHIVFTNMGLNTPDFLMMSGYINSKKSNSRSHKSQQKKALVEIDPAGIHSNTSIELAKLYGIYNPLTSNLKPTNAHANSLINSSTSTDGPSYVRLFTVVNSSKVAEILTSGWYSSGDDDVVLFSSSAEVVASIYGAVEAESFNCDFDLSLYISSTDYDQGSGNNSNADLTGHTKSKSKQRGNTHSTNVQLAKDMVRLNAAMQSKMLLLLSCNINLKGLGGTVVSDNSKSILFSPSIDSRAQLYHQLKDIKRPSKFTVDGFAGGNEKVYTIPSSLLHKTPQVANVDFVALCIAPVIDGLETKSIDGRLEQMIIPRSSMEKNAALLAAYEEELSKSVRKYMDQVLEEVEEIQADSLRRVDNDVINKETALRLLKEEVDKERRIQEGILRDLKQMSINETNSTSTGKVPKTQRR